MAEVQNVVVTNVDISFGQLVWLMVKASFAAAIAAVVTSVIWLAIGAVMFVAVSALGSVLIALLGLLGAAIHAA